MFDCFLCPIGVVRLGSGVRSGASGSSLWVSGGAVIDGTQCFLIFGCLILHEHVYRTVLQLNHHHGLPQEIYYIA